MPQRYKERYRKVIQYIHQHLDESISLEDLAKLAHLSKYHFQRQFSAIFGLSPIQYLQQMRLARSAFELAFRTHSICDIAFNSQFQSQEAYSRAFKRAMGQSPLQFRQMTPWEKLHHSSLNLSDQNTRLLSMDFTTTEQQVEIIDFPTTNIARLSHIGEPALVMKTVARFIEWRRAQGNLSPQQSDTFNILYEDPNSVVASDYRFDVACSVKQAISDNEVGVENAVIDGGKCARLKCVGTNELMAQAIQYLYGEWLVENNAECDDRPLLVKRVTMYPEVAMNQQEFEIYLPLK
ncbi:MAG: AraC family transcriptional regulator [Psychrobium sp.]